MSGPAVLLPLSAVGGVRHGPCYPSLPGYLVMIRPATPVRPGRIRGVRVTTGRNYVALRNGVAGTLVCSRSGRFWIRSINRWAARAFWRDSLGARKVSACEYSQSGYDDSLSQMTSMQTGARCSGTPFSLRITQLIAGCEVPEASDALRFENKAITARAILIATAPMPPAALGKRSTPDENRLTPSSEITENTRSEALGLAETQWQGVLHSMGTECYPRDAIDLFRLGLANQTC